MSPGRAALAWLAERLRNNRHTSAIEDPVPRDGFIAT